MESNQVDDNEERTRREVRVSAPPPLPGATAIELVGVCTNNLQNLDLTIPHRALTVVTGVSGSGKSSLAFETLYAEGQRRFLESMSTYARQFLQRMEKPPVRHVRHILPAIAMRQRGVSAHTRSTVGTVTEIDDHLQMLYAHIGVQECPTCGEEVDRDTVTRIVERLKALGEGTRAVLVAQVKPSEEEENQHVLARLVEEGWRRFWIDGAPKSVEEVDIEALLAAASFPVLVDRLVVKESAVSRLIEAIEGAMELGRGTIEIHLVESQEVLEFHRNFRCNGCGTNWLEPQPAMMNPNTTLGACPTCTGFGKTMGLDLRRVVPNPYRTIRGGAVTVFQTKGKRRQRKRLLEFCAEQGINIDIAWRDLPPKERSLLVDGGRGYTGIRGFFRRLEDNKAKVRNRILAARYRGYSECPECEGARLTAQARHLLVAGRPLHHVHQMAASDALAHFESLELGDEDWGAIEVLYEEVVLRLRYMVAVGLGYLRIDRQTRSLSGGEFQRLQLTSSIGRALTDTLYVLDEPTAGLHARDSARLVEALARLRDIGNTVVVVEHDPEIIIAADHCIEIGPRGGEGGGELLYSGDVPGLRDSPTPTGRMLSGRSATNTERRDVTAKTPCITIRGATHNNLSNIDVEIPLGRLVCVTGVSGSGKSTLVSKILYASYRALMGDSSAVPGAVDSIEGLDRVGQIVHMSQERMGRSSRSNAATYTKAYDAIRKLLAGTRSAKENGITPGHFSFNNRGGRCEVCEGTGRMVIEMAFMADVELQCEVCGGRRFTEPVLAVRYQGKNIDDILKMTVSESVAFFAGNLPITRRLKPLIEVGLGYLRLGQTTATLSGGELQRLKLAGQITAAQKGLGKPDLHIFDEPTVGLHLSDVEVLVTAIQRLVEAGHSVVVVEHNVDFIAAADWVIDIGPEGGDGGGEIVAIGTPEMVAANPDSRTGVYLAEILG